MGSVRSVALLAIIAPISLLAQVPRAALDIAAGSGPHSERTGETWFRDTHGGILRAGAAVRLGQTAKHVAPMLRVDYSAPGMGDQIALCSPAPNGTCRRYFPATDGWSIGAGVLAAAGSRTLVGGSAGFFRSTAHRYVAVDGSYRLTRHVAALAEWRYMNIEYTRGQRVSFRPIEAGVRLY